MLPAALVCRVASWRLLVWSAWAWGATLALLAGVLMVAVAALGP